MAQIDIEVLRMCVQKNIEDGGRDPIAFISDLQAGAASMRREDLIEAYAEIKRDYIPELQQTLD